MAKRIVDILEPVEVRRKQQHLFAPDCMGNQVVATQIEGHAVGQPGQHIDRCQAGCFIGGQLAFGDVAQDVEVSDQLIVAVSDRGQNAVDPEAGAVLAQVPPVVGRAGVFGGRLYFLLQRVLCDVFRSKYDGQGHAMISPAA